MTPFCIKQDSTRCRSHPRGYTELKTLVSSYAERDLNAEQVAETIDGKFMSAFVRATKPPSVL